MQDAYKPNTQLQLEQSLFEKQQDASRVCPSLVMGWKKPSDLLPKSIADIRKLMTGYQQRVLLMSGSKEKLLLKRTDKIEPDREFAPERIVGIKADEENFCCRELQTLSQTREWLTWRIDDGKSCQPDISCERLTHSKFQKQEIQCHDSRMGRVNFVVLTII